MFQPAGFFRKALMNATAGTDHHAHLFLDGRAKRLFINGRWTEATSGRTFASKSPVDGKTLAEIAEGDARDVDLAVAAARKAFEGPWRRTKPFDRQAMLLKLADLVEREF